jgi:uncharacterized membrane protein YdbT with pleckstrin-like domain
MSYVEEVLRPDEGVLQRAQLHWIIYAPPFVLLLAGVVVAFAANGSVLIGLLLVFLGLLAWLMRWIDRMTTEIAVTSQRVIIKRGLIRRSTMEMNARQIESVRVEQSITGRLLDFGTLIIGGTGEGVEVIPRVAAPLVLRNAVSGLTTDRLLRR